MGCIEAFSKLKKHLKSSFSLVFHCICFMITSFSLPAIHIWKYDKDFGVNCSQNSLMETMQRQNTSKLPLWKNTSKCPLWKTCRDKILPKLMTVILINFVSYLFSPCRYFGEHKLRQTFNTSTIANESSEGNVKIYRGEQTHTPSE